MTDNTTLISELASKAFEPVSGRKSLAARLLVIAGGFVLLTEAVVFVPSLANVRKDWLTERFDTAELAVVAQGAAGANGLPQSGSKELLQGAQIISVSLLADGNGQRPQAKRLMGVAASGPVKTIILDDQPLGQSIAETFLTGFAPQGRLLAIVGRPRSNAAIKLEVVVSEAPLRRALLREARQVALGSLGLVALIGALLYSALIDGFVRPMRRLTLAIARFRANPEDASRLLRPSGREDEIGRAEEAFADMQDALRQSLLQRERLAQLGGAVSRISHDLRHSLGAAQLVSERLAMVDDPVVAATAPRLERALERAVGLAESTLRFGKAEEKPPESEPVGLAAALDEAAEEALAGMHEIDFRNDISPSHIALVDPDHVHRIFTNLIRNAAQAIQRSKTKGTISVSADTTPDQTLTIRLVDTGPGLPEKAKANLFAPFAGAGVSGGTGLGLAIARDLARMNGGDVTLASTGSSGTVFQVSLPADT
jgi:signal transduction histidine kinase